MRKSILTFVLLLSATLLRAQTPELLTDLALKYLAQVPAHTAAHAPIVILLHGYGSDERDLFGIRSAFPASLVLSVRAPYPVSGGGYQWYEAASAGGHHDGNEQQLKNSRELIAKFIQQAKTKYKAEGSDVYLVGFSQGAIMCYQAGLTYPASVKGIAPLSGMIFPSLMATARPSAALSRLRIFIGHGTDDNRITFADGEAADSYLRSTLHLLPVFHKYAGMGHTISEEELKELKVWLK